VKFLEYANHGVVAVVQDAPAYSGSVRPNETAILFDSPETLVARLDDLIDDPAARRRLCAAARTYAHAERSEQHHAKNRLAFYRSLLPSTRRALDPRQNGLVETLTADPAAEVDGRHLSMARGRFERLLHDALVVGQIRKDRDTACSLLEEAMLLEPDAYLPYLFAAAFSPDPIPLLEQALSRNPASIQALLLSAQHHAERSNLEVAATRILAAAHACPSYPLPYARMAEHFTLFGQEQEAEDIFRIAAEKRSPFEDLPHETATPPSGVVETAGAPLAE
jgi:hypothetical protein